MLVALMAATLVVLAVATSAQAAPSQSMVYIQNGNVFIAGVDGSNPHQVTTDGKVTSGTSLSDPGSDSTAYHSPTEANDGTIWAPMGFALYHYNQNGTLIKEVVPPGGEYPLAAAVSPDDTKVAYNWDIPTYVGGFNGQTGSSVVTAAGTAAGYADGTQTEDGSWLNDSSTVILGTDKTSATGTYTTEVDYQTPGAADQDWFAPSDPLGAGRGTGFGASNETFGSDQPVVDPTGRYLAVVEKSSYSNNASPTQLQVYSLTGPPPAAPTAVCDYNTTDAYGFLDPEFTDDGSQLVWYDSTGEQVVNMSTVASCPVDPGATTFAGISQASFGPAANAPQPLPAPTTGTGTTTGTPKTTTTPPPAPQPVAFSAASLTFAKSLKRAVLLKQGVKATLICNTTCAYVVVVAASNSLARKLGLTKKKGEVLLGDKTGRFTGGKLTVAVKLSPKALKALRRSKLKTIALILDVAAKGVNGKRVDHTYTLTIKR